MFAYVIKCRDVLGSVPLATSDVRKRNTVMHVVTTGKTAMELVCHGLSPDTKNSEGDTPLHLASNADVTAVLIAAGASVNIENDMGLTPIENGLGDVRVAKVLIANGADIVRLDMIGMGVLHRVKNVRVAEVILESGGNPNQRTTGTRKTPLFFAQSVEMCLLLVENGVCLDARDVLGRTALMYMCSSLEHASEGVRGTKERMIQYLAMSGASLDLVDYACEKVEDIAGDAHRSFLLSVRQRVGLKGMARVVDRAFLCKKAVERKDVITQTLGMCLEVRDVIIGFV